VTDGVAVVPDWFAKHRGRVLALVTLPSMIALGVTFHPLAWSPIGPRLPFIILLVLAVVSASLLLVGAVTQRCWPIRKGAGIAVLMWRSLVVTLIAPSGGEVFGTDAIILTWAAVMIDVPNMFMAGWLYWVAGRRDGCR